MYIDYPHDIKKSGKYVIKTLNDIKHLKKEFAIQKFLSKYELAPKVINLEEHTFKEEFVEGSLLKDVNLNSSVVVELAKTLKKIHTIKIPKKIKVLIEDKFTMSGIYQPRLILQELVKDINDEELNSYFNIANNYIKSVENYLKDKAGYMCLIHGDLSKNNIMIRNNKIVIIDWTDCRLDIPSTDISQLFYLCDFTDTQKEIFLNEYNNRDFINKDLIDLNTILLLIYDLNKKFKETGLHDTGLLKKLKSYA